MRLIVTQRFGPMLKVPLLAVQLFWLFVSHMNVWLFFLFLFFFFAKLQYHSTEKEESTLEESTTQAERTTSGRFSSLKHKGEAKLKANFAAIWAATLQNLRAQTKEQQRKDKAELRILKVPLLMAQLGTEGLSDRESMHTLESLFMST